MTIFRRAARRDANEKELVTAARAVGIRLWQLDTPCDWLALINGMWWPVEIKLPQGPRGGKSHSDLTPDQKQFVADAENAGGQVLIWRTVDDVLASVGK